MTFRAAIATLWFAWFVSWNIARLWVNRTVKHDVVSKEIGFRIVFILGAILLFVEGGVSNAWGFKPMWHANVFVRSLCLGFVVIGLLFTWWARIHLGRLWSDLVVKKAGHRVIETGPYRWVRHPIYSGLILAAVATAGEKGTPIALVGAVLIALSFYVKARREERFLRAELGADAYGSYARHVGMLVPFVRG